MTWCVVIGFTGGGVMKFITPFDDDIGSAREAFEEMLKGDSINLQPIDLVMDKITASLYGATGYWARDDLGIMSYPQSGIRLNVMTATIAWWQIAKPSHKDITQ